MHGQTVEEREREEDRDEKERESYFCILYLNELDGECRLSDPTSTHNN